MALVATAQKIGNRSFLISWVVDYGTFFDVSPKQQAEVNKSEFFESCQLIFEIDEDNERLSLEMTNVVFAKGLMPLRIKNGVIASYDGIPQIMKFQKSNWKTFWKMPNLRPDCYLCDARLIRSYSPSSYRSFICPNSCGMSEIDVAKFVFQIIVETEPTSIDFLKNGEKRVLNHLSELWESKTLADVTFKCAEKSIKAHTLILASGSPVLAAMFQHDFVENRERVIEISDINPIVFENLLRYIYTGDVGLLEITHVAQLLVAADKYDVDYLKDECAQLLSRNVTLETATEYLVLSHLHNSSELHELTLEFMSGNAEAVCCRNDWMEVIKNYPELSFIVVQRMVKKITSVNKIQTMKKALKPYL